MAVRLRPFGDLQDRRDVRHDDFGPEVIDRLDVLTHARLAHHERVEEAAIEGAVVQAVLPPRHQRLARSTRPTGTGCVVPASRPPNRSRGTSWRRGVRNFPAYSRSAAARRWSRRSLLNSIPLRCEGAISSSKFVADVLLGQQRQARVVLAVWRYRAGPRCPAPASAGDRTAPPASSAPSAAAASPLQLCRPVPAASHWPRSYSRRYASVLRPAQHGFIGREQCAAGTGFRTGSCPRLLFRPGQGPFEQARPGTRAPAPKRPMQMLHVLRYRRCSSSPAATRAASTGRRAVPPPTTDRRQRRQPAVQRPARRARRGLAARSTRSRRPHSGDGSPCSRIASLM